MKKPKPFRKVLVSNRGEIALRIMRTLRELGIKSVAVYSEADRSSMHVLHADEAVCIGPAPAGQSYLDIKSILSAAKLTRADAVHPGYGFLSENANFARAVESQNITFIGPAPDSIEVLGYKSTARKLAIKNKVPVTPGTKGCVGKNCRRDAKKVGYPIMIKASAGGGGKGMRLVKNKHELIKQIEMARAESRAAFGDDKVYLEKYIENPRHIEVQIAADSYGNVIAFPERDCSLQRRHQKLVEESPSPAVNAKIRKKLAASATRLAKAAKYCGVGTVEFLMDKKGRFYFMEVNTRLQVEHPVTEAVSGIDLVREQISIAQGEKLSVDKKYSLKLNGCAIEHRINAEDPQNNFAPSPGKVTEWFPAGGPGIRVDSHIYTGYEIPSFYDSLIAKLIVWAPNRKLALQRSRRALAEFRVSGIKTTIDFHKEIVENKDFIEGNVDTGLLERMRY